jgi:hypothetical protein
VKRHRILIVSIVILVIVGIVVGIYWRRWSGPSYHGRSLRSWLEEGKRKWYESGDAGSQPAKEAVQHIGTNAIPTLLRMFRATDSPLTKKLVALQNKFEFLPEPNTASDDHYLAIWGFNWLGSDATNAIPEMRNIYRENIPDSSESAYEFLLAFVPAEEKSALLHEGLTNQNYEVRMTALDKFVDISTPEVALPVLITALSDPVTLNQDEAAKRLRKLGTNALPAVPALVPFAAMSITNPFYYSARSTLIDLDPVVAAKVLGAVLTNDPGSYARFTNRMAKVKKDEESVKNGKPRVD